MDNPSPAVASADADFVSSLLGQTRNPDILTCLANLSSDEIFTPPNVANQMLDLLPQELFRSPDTTFLDPACKSGVFLREIAKRLIKGLEDVIPDLRERLEHIYRKQLFGIAITELTSLLSRRTLYCSRYPDGRYSVVRCDSTEGNIRFRRVEHVWKDGKCEICGASESVYGEEARGARESHAYEFIHVDDPKEILKMKFDVVIGNPPYQLSDGGAQASATPLYDQFVETAIDMDPRFLSLIIPARWYAGGKGLDCFRDKIMDDTRMKVLHDFSNAAECFPNVEIKGGVCYFLWDREYSGMCQVYNHNNDGRCDEAVRYLREDGCSTVIRYNKAVSILRKVRNKREATFADYVSSRRPFGFGTNFRGSKVKENDSVVLYENSGKAYVARKDLPKGDDLVDTYKVFISRAYGAGETYPHQILNRPFFGDIGTCCTETYLLIGPFESKDIALNVITYISTRFFRFLVLLKKVTQDATSKVYELVPCQDFSKPWTDAELYAKYGLTDEEIAFIESMIRPMDDSTKEAKEETSDEEV